MLARSVARLTLTSTTPGWRFSARSTLRTQAAQVMPVTGSTISFALMAVWLSLCVLLHSLPHHTFSYSSTSTPPLLFG